MPLRRSDTRYPGFTQRLDAAIRAAGYERRGKIDVLRLARDLETSTTNVYRWLAGLFPAKWMPKLLAVLRVPEAFLLFGVEWLPVERRMRAGSVPATAPPALRGPSAAPAPKAPLFDPVPLDAFIALARRWAESVGPNYEWFDFFRATMTGFYNGLARTGHFTRADELEHLQMLARWRVGDVPWHVRATIPATVRETNQPEAVAPWNGVAERRQAEAPERLLGAVLQMIVTNPDAEERARLWHRIDEVRRASQSATAAAPLRPSTRQRRRRKQA
jgi:hypothetical protein